MTGRGKGQIKSHYFTFPSINKHISPYSNDNINHETKSLRQRNVACHKNIITLQIDTITNTQQEMVHECSSPNFYNQDLLPTYTH